LRRVCPDIVIENAKLSRENTPKTQNKQAGPMYEKHTQKLLTKGLNLNQQALNCTPVLVP